MGYVIIFLVFMVSLGLQGSVLALAGPQGVQPDILLVVVVVIGLLSDSKRGAMVGLAAGLMQDIVFGAPLGFFAFTKALTGALAGMMSDDIYKDLVLAPMLVVAFLSAFTDTTTFLLAKLYGVSQPLALVPYLQQFTLVRVLMHFFIMGLIYPWLYRAHNHHLLLPHTVEME
jgi:rod shape-determining protein MreD